MDANPSAYRKIKEASKRWAADSDFGLRLANAELLAQINDPQSIQLLEKMATDDPQDFHRHVRSCSSLRT
jgi:hypothetical protein